MAETPDRAKKIMIGKFNGLTLIFISPAAACFMSHNNKVEPMASQSKNCLLNSKYSLVQGKKNKGRRKMVAFIIIEISLSNWNINFSGITKF